MSSAHNAQGVSSPDQPAKIPRPPQNKYAPRPCWECPHPKAAGFQAVGCPLSSTHTHRQQPQRKTGDTPSSPRGPPTFLELTNDPSAPPQGHQLHLHPPHYSPQTHLTAAGSSLRLPQHPPPPSHAQGAPVSCTLLSCPYPAGHQLWEPQLAGGAGRWGKRVLGSQLLGLSLQTLSQCLTCLTSLTKRYPKGQLFLVRPR